MFGHLRKCAGYAWHPHTGKWWAPVMGALALWCLAQMTGLPLSFPDGVVGFVAQTLAFVVSATVLIFLARFAWAPIYFHWFEKSGGVLATLRTTLGIYMLPVILMSSGVIAFVALFGSGAVLFAIRFNASPASPTSTAVMPAVAVPASPYEKDRQLMAIDQARDIIMNNIQPLVEEGVHLHDNLMPLIQDGTAAVKLNDFAQRFRAALNELQKLKDTYNAYYFMNDLVFKPNPYEVVGSAQHLADEMSNTAALGNLVNDRYFVDLDRSLQSMYGWTNEMKTHLQSARFDVMRL